MRADFLDAHKRHLDDAERLFKEARWANADHLYGIAAECGLKRLMLAFNMPYDANKDCPGNNSDRVHANKIWARFEAYRSGHILGTAYVLPANPSNPFADWDVAQRYANQDQFDQTRAASHKLGANTVYELIDRAKKQGLI
jgi:hypothetical protein